MKIDLLIKSKNEYIQKNAVKMLRNVIIGKLFFLFFVSFIYGIQDRPYIELGVSFLLMIYVFVLSLGSFYEKFNKYDEERRVLTTQIINQIIQDNGLCHAKYYLKELKDSELRYENRFQKNVFNVMKPMIFGALLLSLIFFVIFSFLGNSLLSTFSYVVLPIFSIGFSIYYVKKESKLFYSIMDDFFIYEESRINLIENYLNVGEQALIFFNEKEINVKHKDEQLVFKNNIIKQVRKDILKYDFKKGEPDLFIDDEFKLSTKRLILTSIFN